MKNSAQKLTCIAAVFFLGMYANAQQSRDTAVANEQKIEEVIMIGYGTARKSDLTGSVAVIGGEELRKVPVSNVAETLTGKVAGVNIASTEGSPDADITIRVRGGGSLTQDASPLVIVDGFPVNSLSDISPNDIENISILKDASSTAIYGARGANGVILVTTKSGRRGKISVNFNTFTGFKRIAKTLPTLDSYDYALWQYEYALLRDNFEDTYEKYFGTWEDIGQYRNYQGTDYQKAIYGRTGTVNSNDVSIRGGDEKLNYNVSFANFTEKGIMLRSGFRRNNLSLNLKNKASEKIDLAFTFRYSDTNIDGSGANEQKEFSSSDGRLRHAIGYSPIYVPSLMDDDTDELVASYMINPFISVDDNFRKQERRNYNVLGSFSYKFNRHLTWKTDGGFDFLRYMDDRFYGASTFYVRNIPLTENQGKPALISSIREDRRARIANTLNFDSRSMLGSNHRLKVLLGQEYLELKSNTLTNTIHGFPDFFKFENAVKLTTQGIPHSVENYFNPDDRLLSFFTRVNYDLFNKYLFTATFRADGSSKFLNDNRWGYFPSFAAAWKINEENFLKSTDWIQMLKLRISYGESGNNNIPTGQTLQLFQSGTSAWINDISNFWAASKIMANPDLKWETTVTQNIGLDYDLLRGRVSGSVELYKNVVKDLLIQFPVQGTGYDFQFRNMGEVQNKGIEATLNLAAVKKENYDLNFSFNIGINKNRINSLGVMDDVSAFTNWASTAIGNDYMAIIGQPIGSIYGYKSNGRYEVSDFDYNADTGVYTLKDGIVNSSVVVGNVRPGSMKLADLNGDGIVDASDRTIIGNVQPKHTGGFVMNARVKNFDLLAQFNWSYGNKVYNATKIEHTTATASSPNGQYRNLLDIMESGERWTNIDPNTGALITDPTQLAALNANTTMWSPAMARFVLTDWAIEDGSFLRLNTLTLGYSFPESLVEKLRVSRIRLYATANNVFVLTKYSGLDPEVNTRRSTPLTPNVDYSPYPRSRQYILGLNLSF